MHKRLRTTGTTLIAGVTHHLLLRPRIDAAKLAEAWAARLRDVLPQDEFEVSVSSDVVRIKGLGARQGFGLVSTPAPALRLPVPVPQQLRAFVDSASRDLQAFITNARGEPWPGADAEPQVTVDAESICVEWREGSGGPLIEMRPMTRAEIGL